MSNVGYF